MSTDLVTVHDGASFLASLAEARRYLESVAGREPVRVTFYGLLDPLDGRVRYVGSTSRSLDVRVAEHRLSGTIEVRAWLRSIAPREPVAVVLREGVYFCRAERGAEEERLILRFRAWGADLLNQPEPARSVRSDWGGQPMSLDLVKADSLPLAVAQAREYLAACRSPADAKALRDKAEAAQVWASRQENAHALEMAAGEIRVLASAKLGELLPAKATPEERARRGGEAKAGRAPASSPAKEAEAGLSWKDAHNARLLASMSSESRERAIADAKSKGRAPTVEAIVKVAKDERKREAREAVQAKSAAEVKASAPGLFASVLDAPAGRYRTIYIDPPWSYDDEGCQGAAEGHYSTMDEDALLALDVKRLAHPEGCHLWMWVTWPKLRDGTPQKLIEAWGFEWKSEAVWHKAGRIHTRALPPEEHRGVADDPKVIAARRKKQGDMREALGYERDSGAEARAARADVAARTVHHRDVKPESARPSGVLFDAGSPSDAH